jgi:hypothetical protein
VSSTASGFPGSRPTTSAPIAAVFGRRPVATSSSSTTSVPSPARSSIRSFAAAATDSSRYPSRTSTPSSRMAAATRSPANGSVPGNSRGPRCMRTTSEPSRRNAWAISQPTTPPPSTPSRAGTDLADVASRDPQVRTASRPGTGGATGTLPVQTTTARDATSVSRPSGPSTSTVRSPTMRPVPRTTRIPAPVAQSTWLVSSQSWVNESRRARTAAGSNSAVVPGSLRSAATACPVRSSTFDGMHAQNEHSPPSSSDSTISAESPARRA